MPRLSRATILARHGVGPLPTPAELAGDFMDCVGPSGMKPAGEKKKRTRPEDELHCGLAKVLRYAIAPPGACNSDGVMWFTIEQASGRATFGKDRNGRSFDPLGQRNKAKGMRSGVPDIFLCHNGRALWLELKAGKNSTSDNQDEMHAALKRAGSNVAVCYSVDQAMDALRGWGVPLRAAI